MLIRRTRSCPGTLRLTEDSRPSGEASRPEETPTDLRASARRQTDRLIERNQREASSARAPGIGGQPLVSGAGVRLSTYAWRVDPDVSWQVPELRGDRFGLTANMPAIGNHMAAASFYYDTVAFADSHQGGNGLGYSGFAMFREGEISPGWSVGLLCPGGVTLGFSLATKLIGRGGLRVLNHENGMFLVEQRARRAQGPQASFGAGLTLAGPLPWMGLVGRAALQWGETKTLRARVTAGRLAGIENTGQMHQAAIAWDVCDPVLPWPAPTLPADGLELPHIQPGERFTRNLDASGKYGASLALFGVLHGRHVAWDNRIEASAERPNAWTFRIGLITEQAEAVTYAIELPIFAHASQTRLGSRAMEQVFEFDMTLPHARAAAAAFWHGVPPEGAWEAPLAAPDPRDLVHLACRDALPAGITRSRVTWLERPAETLTGVEAGLPWYTPRRMRAGRGQLRRSSSDRCLGWFAGEVRVTHRWQTSSLAQRYHSDERTRTIAANHRQTITDAGVQAADTQVTMQWRYGRFGSRARTRAVHWLNEHLLAEAPLPSFPAGLPATPYTLEVTRSAPAHLAHVPCPRGTQEDLLAGTLAAPVDFVNLCAELGTRGDLAMPWLHAMAGGVADDLHWAASVPETDSAIYLAQVTHALDINGRIELKEPLSEQAARLQNLERQRRRLDERLEAMQADPIGLRFGNVAWRHSLAGVRDAVAATERADALAVLDKDLERLWDAWSGGVLR